MVVLIGEELVTGNHNNTQSDSLTLGILQAGNWNGGSWTFSLRSKRYQ